MLQVKDTKDYKTTDTTDYTDKTSVWTENFYIISRNILQSLMQANFNRIQFCNNGSFKKPTSVRI